MTAAQPVVVPTADFELTARVAHGGMATIYAGERDGEQIAVKLLHPHLAEDPHIRAMFLHEAQLAARLAHDNVVRVLDHGVHPEHGAFILMELLDGGDLAALFKAATKGARPLPPNVVAQLVIDLCRGLEAAHSLRAEDGSPLHLIHRDVSPHNLLVSTDGVARLTDFGIAKSDERYTMTRPGQLKGKLAYMAPEQLAHEDSLDHRVDVFAAGVVLWEALVGRRLFKGDDEISVINKVLLEKVPPPSTFDAALAPFDAVVMKALARERENRFSSAAALADAIEQAFEPLGGVAPRAEVAALITDLLGDALSQRAERISRASLTPPRLGSGAFVVTQTEVGQAEVERSAAAPAPPHRAWRWALVALLVLGGGAVGAAIAVSLAPTGASAPAALEASVPPAARPEPAPAVVEAPETDAPAAEAPEADVPETDVHEAEVPEAELPEGPALDEPSARRRRARPRGAADDPPSATPGEAARETGSEPPAAPSRGAPPSDDLYPNPFRD